METALVAAATLVSAAYLALVTSNLLGMRRLGRGRAEKRPRVSVLVAARDEEAHLPRCLEALLAQDYPAPLEIVVVDDRSRDATGEILADFAARNPRLLGLRVDACAPGLSPKMFALERALEAASGEVLCVTDADCVPPATWVSELVAHFEPDTGFVAGPALRLSPRPGSSLVADLAKVASISGIVMGAGGSAWGLPWTCAGANLAYRREAIDSIGGYAALHAVASGDDDLLMLSIARAGWRVAYALDPRACVPTFEEPSLERFASQQIRHNARFREQPQRIQAMSLVVFFYYLWFLTGPLLAVGSATLGWLWLGTASARLALDALAITGGARRVGARVGARTLLRALPPFPLLVVASALAGLRGRFTWKGQHFEKPRQRLGASPTPAPEDRP